MSYQFRPAIREQTPLIIGLAGPTKSGKTMSALRLATGMANGGTIAMINAEGPRGHQYAEKFKYVACEITPPYRPGSYTEALLAAKILNPAVLIIDSVSHMHDGPGGILEWHEEILDRIAKDDFQKRQKATFVAWVEPKAAENKFIYTMLDMKCPVILAMRAKEKIKIVPGKPPVDLGWQPIVGERVAFETIFTLMLTPHCKGMPDLSLSDMREPFDTMINPRIALDEGLGESLAKWASGGTEKAAADGARSYPVQTSPPDQLSTQQASDVLPPLSHEDADRAIAREDAMVEWKSQLVNFHGTKGQANALWKKVSTDLLLTDEDKRQLYPYYSDAMRHGTA